MPLSSIRAQLGALSDALSAPTLDRTAATIAGQGTPVNAAAVSQATIVAALQTLIAIHCDLVTAIAPALPKAAVTAAATPVASNPVASQAQVTPS